MSNDLEQRSEPVADQPSVPPPPAAAPPVAAERRRPGCAIFGHILIALGVLILAHNLGWIRWIEWQTWWPLLLIVCGFMLIFKRRGRG